MAENKQTNLTYRDSGVDIDAGNYSVKLIKDSVKATYRPEVLGDLGGFGGLFALNSGKYKEPVLVSGTDGVGTKLRLAFMLDKHDTIGQDAVAMCVNDILVQGAEPLFFLDYLAVGKLDPQQVATVVKGVANACKESGCALIGGETAEMSGFEVKGFDGSEKFDELGGKTLGEELLTPTRLYPSVCLPLIEKYDIHGMVHVTGGGFYENISRILPEGTGVSVNADAWEMPAIFKLLQQWGNVDWHEMYRVFNMGIGMILLVSSEDAKSIQADLAAKGEKSYIIGEVVEGNQTVEVKGGVFNE